MELASTMESAVHRQHSSLENEWNSWHFQTTNIGSNVFFSIFFLMQQQFGARADFETISEKEEGCCRALALSVPPHFCEA